MEDTNRSGSNASATSNSSVTPSTTIIPIAAINYAHQAEKLSHLSRDEDEVGSGTAVKAEYITPHDPVIITADGGRLPGVPLAEAEHLNSLKAEIDGVPEDATEEIPIGNQLSPQKIRDSSGSGSRSPHDKASIQKSG